ncbi:hypothetical protein AALP_AA6G268500 [Arabis alpina]|uniref:Uncharacterized protein n=1 Tax=Arabis alpina TaxID=50452 RepID=A0A087GRX9_ARAAL|nr:hypothetical protein AALP_AA6G268500 [Arabis alpina]
MSRRELKNLSRGDDQILRDYDPSDEEKRSSLTGIPTQRRERHRKCTLLQPSDHSNEGYDFSSEEENNDSSSDADYKPRKSGKRRSQPSSKNKIPARRRGRPKNKIRIKRERRGVMSSQPLENIHQTFASSSNDKDKAPISSSNESNNDEKNPEEIKGNNPLVVEWGKNEMHQRKIENRVERLVGNLQELKEIEEKVSIFFLCIHITQTLAMLLVSMDEQKIPNLEKPQLTLNPSFTMKSLCEYMAPYIEVRGEEIEVYVVKELVKYLKVIDPSKDKMEIVNKERNMGALRMYNFNYGCVLLTYRKITSSEEE